MGDIKNPEIWLENIGEIMLSEEGEFYWMLPDIFIYTYECCVASPYFNFDQESWRLVILPSDGTSSILSDNSHFGLFLWLKGGYTLKQKYSVQLCVKPPGGKNVFGCSGEIDAHYGFGRWDFIEVTSLGSTEFVLSGRLKISCIIMRKDDDDDSSRSSSLSECEEAQNEVVNVSNLKQKNGLETKDGIKLLQSFKNLLDSESGCDVILKTSDKEFNAHRIILSARSPVFSSMFQHDMVEKQKGEVDISDCSTSAFKVFLQYLYSESTDTISPANVLDLYYIADKYQVGDLKSYCVEYMKCNLAVYNFCDIIILSLRHNEYDLQTFATRFFCRNVKKIMKSVQWQKYITENPLQANELILKAINA